MLLICAFSKLERFVVELPTFHTCQENFIYPTRMLCIFGYTILVSVTFNSL